MNLTPTPHISFYLHSAPPFGLQLRPLPPSSTGSLLFPFHVIDRVPKTHPQSHQIYNKGSQILQHFTESRTRKYLIPPSWLRSSADLVCGFVVEYLLLLLLLWLVLIFLFFFLPFGFGLVGCSDLLMKGVFVCWKLFLFSMFWKRLESGYPFHILLKIHNDETLIDVDGFLNNTLFLKPCFNHCYVNSKVGENGCM